MPAVHSRLQMAGTRMRGLSAAVDNDEPLRKQEASSSTGPAGKSAYEVWLDEGNVGSQADFLASLVSTVPGPPGEDSTVPGPPGEPGEDSTVPGPPGEDGAPGRDFYNRRIGRITGATGSVECNWALYDEIRIAMVGNVSLTFSGGNDGQGCTLKLTQDATGSRTVTLPGEVRFSADVTGYVATTTASKSDRIGFIRDADDSKYDFVSLIKGF